MSRLIHLIFRNYEEKGRFAVLCAIRNKGHLGALRDKRAVRDYLKRGEALRDSDFKGDIFVKRLKPFLRYLLAEEKLVGFPAAFRGKLDKTFAFFGLPYHLPRHASRRG